MDEILDPNALKHLSQLDKLRNIMDHFTSLRKLGVTFDSLPLKLQLGGIYYILSYNEDGKASLEIDNSRNPITFVPNASKTPNHILTPPHQILNSSFGVSNTSNENRHVLPQPRPIQFNQIHRSSATNRANSVSLPIRPHNPSSIDQIQHCSPVNILQAPSHMNNTHNLHFLRAQASAYNYSVQNQFAARPSYNHSINLSNSGMSSPVIPVQNSAINVNDRQASEPFLPNLTKTAEPSIPQIRASISATNPPSIDPAPETQSPQFPPNSKFSVVSSEAEVKPNIASSPKTKTTNLSIERPSNITIKQETIESSLKPLELAIENKALQDSLSTKSNFETILEKDEVEELELDILPSVLKLLDTPDCTSPSLTSTPQERTISLGLTEHSSPFASNINSQPEVTDNSSQNNSTKVKPRTFKVISNEKNNSDCLFGVVPDINRNLETEKTASSIDKVFSRRSLLNEGIYENADNMDFEADAADFDLFEETCQEPSKVITADKNTDKEIIETPTSCTINNKISKVSNSSEGPIKIEPIDNPISRTSFIQLNSSKVKKEKIEERVSISNVKQEKIEEPLKFASKPLDSCKVTNSEIVPPLIVNNNSVSPALPIIIQSTLQTTENGSLSTDREENSSVPNTPAVISNKKDIEPSLSEPTKEVQTLHKQNIDVSSNDSLNVDNIACFSPEPFNDNTLDKNISLATANKPKVASKSNNLPNTDFNNNGGRPSITHSKISSPPKDTTSTTDAFFELSCIWPSPTLSEELDYNPFKSTPITKNFKVIDSSSDIEDLLNDPVLPLTLSQKSLHISKESVPLTNPPESSITHNEDNTLHNLTKKKKKLKKATDPNQNPAGVNAPLIPSSSRNSVSTNEKDSAVPRNTNNSQPSLVIDLTGPEPSSSVTQNKGMLDRKKQVTMLANRMEALKKLQQSTDMSPIQQPPKRPLDNAINSASTSINGAEKHKKAKVYPSTNSSRTITSKQLNSASKSGLIDNQSTSSRSNNRIHPDPKLVLSYKSNSLETQRSHSTDQFSQRGSDYNIRSNQVSQVKPKFNSTLDNSRRVGPSFYEPNGRSLSRSNSSYHTPVASRTSASKDSGPSLFKNSIDRNSSSHPDSRRNEDMHRNTKRYENSDISKPVNSRPSLKTANQLNTRRPHEPEKHTTSIYKSVSSDVTPKNSTNDQSTETFLTQLQKNGSTSRPPQLPAGPSILKRSHQPNPTNNNSLPLTPKNSQSTLKLISAKDTPKNDGAVPSRCSSYNNKSTSSRNHSSDVVSSSFSPSTLRADNYSNSSGSCVRAPITKRSAPHNDEIDVPSRHRPYQPGIQINSLSSSTPDKSITKPIMKDQLIINASHVIRPENKQSLNKPTQIKDPSTKLNIPENPFGFLGSNKPPNSSRDLDHNKLILSSISSDDNEIADLYSQIYDFLKETKENEKHNRRHLNRLPRFNFRNLTQAFAVHFDHYRNLADKRIEINYLFEVHLDYFLSLAYLGSNWNNNQTRDCYTDILESEYKDLITNGLRGSPMPYRDVDQYMACIKGAWTICRYVGPSLYYYSEHLFPISNFVALTGSESGIAEYLKQLGYKDEYHASDWYFNDIPGVRNKF